MLRLKPMLVAACLSLGLTAPAQAVVVVGSFTGQITSGNDIGGTFTNTPGGGEELATFDAGDGEGFIEGTFSYQSDLAGVGGNFGGDVNWLAFQVTIAGTPYTFGLPDPSLNHQSIFMDGDTLSDILTLTFVQDGAEGTELISLDFSGGNFLTSDEFLPESFSYSGPSEFLSSLTIQKGAVAATADFSITSVQAAVVPEPGTWMTLILGFGVVGWALRRRRGAFGKRRVAA